MGRKNLMLCPHPQRSAEDALTSPHARSSRAVSTGRDSAVAQGGLSSRLRQRKNVAHRLVDPSVQLVDPNLRRFDEDVLHQLR